MALLEEYLNTYQRANPAQGLLQGLQIGSNFGLALRQQQLAEQQYEEQKKEKDKANDMRTIGVLFEAAPKMQSKALRAQTMQKAFDLLGKYNESLSGVVVDPNDDTFNEFTTKARRFKKTLVDNPDMALKDIDQFLQEMASEKDQGNLEEKQYKEIVDTVTGVKKEAAGELGGLAAYPEQFRGDQAYQTPQAKAGIAGYQDQLASQMQSLGETTASNALIDNLRQRRNDEQRDIEGTTRQRDAYKDDAVMTRIVNSFNANPAVRKVEQMDQFSNLIIDVAHSDNPIGHASLETLMARASGEVGNLSEADKKPFGGSRALTEKMKQYFSELYKGKKTPENLEFISKLADAFKQTGIRKKKSLARELANQYAKANKSRGWTAKDIYEMLSPYDSYEEVDNKGHNKKMTFNPATGSFE